MSVRPIVSALGLAACLVASVVSVVPEVGAQSTVRDITLPVDPAHVSSVYWSDTYGAPRGGGRTHIGVDIMGPKMTPLVAAASGTVTWIRHDATAGNNLEITDAEGWAYHYVHINNDTPGTDDGANLLEYAFAPGIQLGATVTAGQVVAYLGDSGNAESTGAHLHFEIEDPSGQPINPTASVDAAKLRVGLPSVPSNLLGPYGNIGALSNDLFVTLNGRQPSTAEATALAQRVLAEGLAGAVAPYVGATSPAARIDRLYVAYFLRAPDFGGLRYWIDTQGSGVSLTRIADAFADSAEFKARYGSLPFGDFIDQLYRDVLGREPDAGGRAYWLDLLQRKKVTKGSIVVFFTEGQELVGRTSLRSELVALTALFDDAAPTDEQVARWTADRQTMSLVDAATAWFLTSR